ncbi:MAG TPA: cytochrome c biogenesis protein ResB [Desulfuromonadaceae bacterium]|nr:cytochrome c biogenesis protein ResB [Desulfuromonadaceae bacterium]
MNNPILRFFSSVRLTVACLVLGCILVFWGTVAQVHLGLYKAQNEFFRSFFIYGQAGDLKVPIFPGGYLIGSVLLLNLLVAHARYYKPGKRKIGIILIHFGIVLLLVGQMLTDALSIESQMHLRIGETRNFSEADRAFELAVIDTSGKDTDQVVAIPARRLAHSDEFTDPKLLPFTLRIKTYYANSSLMEQPMAGYEKPKITAGLGSNVYWREMPRETEMNRVDVPSALIEIATPHGSPGTFLVSGFVERPQAFQLDGRTYQMILRPQRFYKPFSIHLVEFHHDVYPGTDIPKNFSSRVRLQNLQTKEDREVLIYMNNPLRYGGETFYQASYDPDDGGSVLQDVRNPGWLTPYFSCVLVAVGLVWQFLSSLIPFLKRRAA